MPNERIEIKVNGGKIFAEENMNPDFPEICVCLQLDNGEILNLVLVEHDKDNSINLYHYEDVWNEDWTRKNTIDLNEAKKIDLNDNEKETP